MISFFNQMYYFCTKKKKVSDEGLIKTVQTSKISSILVITSIKDM